MVYGFDECDWHPTKVLRSISAVKSSTQVVHVETDAGDAYLKGLGNPQGNECLAFELVGTRLARACGLFVPDYAVLDHQFLELTRADGGLVGFGPAFLSRALPGSPGGGADTFLNQLLNPEDVPLLVALDTWLANGDRCPPDGALDPTPNWDNVFFVPIGNRYQLTVFDHTHCFAEGQLDEALNGRAFEQDDRVYGAFPEFGRFLSEDSLRRATATIRDVDGSVLRSVVNSLPPEWEISSGARKEWLEQLDGRRSRLEKILLDKLIVQRVLEF